MYIFGDTDIIGPPYYDDMGSESGSIYVFFRRDCGAWDEVQKTTQQMWMLVIGLDLGWLYT